MRGRLGSALGKVQAGRTVHRLNRRYNTGPVMLSVGRRSALPPDLEDPPRDEANLTGMPQNNQFRQAGTANCPGRRRSRREYMDAAVNGRYWETHLFDQAGERRRCVALSYSATCGTRFRPSRVSVGSGLSVGGSGCGAIRSRSSAERPLVKSTIDIKVPDRYRA
jgi:hypothetical protein